MNTANNKFTENGIINVIYSHHEKAKKKNCSLGVEQQSFTHSLTHSLTRSLKG
jgi:metal-responsive CopG/Arc/MetJ family transcriptional regulator